MKVLYIYRNQSLGFSIAKVFRSIESEMRKYVDVVDSVFLPMAGAKPWQLWQNIMAARQAMLAKDYDIVHITGSEYYLIPFLRGKRKVIVTVHDLGFFVNSHLSPRTIMLYLFWIKTLKCAGHVTCISEKTMVEVRKYVNIKTEKISIVYNPVGDDFIYKPKEFDALCPLVLHLGTRPHKNLINTIVALKDFPCKLRIIGELTEEQKTLLNIYHFNYTSVSNLTDEEIVREYEQCDIVNFPSLYEGFGMPIIEGQAVGRVVVTSDLSPMREIAKGSAVLVDPTVPSSILNGYKEALEKYEELVNKGLENVKRFKLVVATKKYYSIYKELVK